MSTLLFVRRLAFPLLFGTATLLVAQPAGTPPPGKAGSPPAQSDLTPEEIPDEPDLPLVAKFDHQGDHLLDPAERKAARDYLASQPKPEPALTGHTGILRPPPVALEPVHPGGKIIPAAVTAVPDAPLYDLHTLRTVFLEFADADWEQELADLARTDVLVPARLTVDGRTYADVGVRFRPSPDPAGYKHSLQLVLDYAHPGQTLGGQRQLELLTPQADATFVRSILYHQIARDYVYAPEANYVRVVINGENWGIYLNTQPFDERLVQSHFGTSAGARWVAAPGATLADLGSDPAAYRRSYRLQSPEDPAAWAALAKLCQVLNQTPPDKLEAALAPLLDVDGTLRFLALENALVNQDGYWNRGGGYGLYLDPAGLFHLIPLEAGTVFQYQQVAEMTTESGGRNSGGGGGRQGGGRGEGGAAGRTDRDLAPEIKAYQRSRDFPRQATTDLAMLLSYSFINKADQNDDRKLTETELLDFISSWFTIMDEEGNGFLTRELFIAKFRRFIAPPSVRDGRSQQTFGKDDAPAAIGRDLFDAMDKDHDGQLTREEFVGAFKAWFAAWSEPKTKLLTEDGLYRGLNNVLTQTIFEADQTLIDRKNFTVQADDSRNDAGEGKRGGRAGGGENNGVSLGLPGIPHLGLGGGGGSGGGPTHTVAYRNAELTPLHGVGMKSRPLLEKLLAVPSLRNRYLADIYDITEHWLQWSRLGPLAKDCQALIADDVKTETHKPTSYTHFVQQIDQDAALAAAGEDDTLSLKAFVKKRHDALLDDSNIHRAIGIQ